MKYLITCIFKYKAKNCTLFFQKNVEIFPIVPVGSEFIPNFPAGGQYKGKIDFYSVSDDGKHIEIIVKHEQEIKSEKDIDFLKSSFGRDYQYAII